MSRNPYADQDPFNTNRPQPDAGPGGGQPDYAEPPRTSGWGVASLVFSVLCCIPLLSVIGTGLGIIGIFRIGTSQGRLKGMGLAMAGTGLGLVVTVLHIAIAAMFNTMIREFYNYQSLTVALEAGDAATAQTHLAPSLALTDEELLVWWDTVNDDLGAYTPLEPSIAGYFSGVMEAGTLVQQSQAAVSLAYPDGAIPLPASFDAADTIIWFVPDTTGGTIDGGNLPPVLNVGVVASDGTINWLVDPAAGTPAAAAPDDQDQAAPDPDPSDDAGASNDNGDAANPDEAGG